MSNVTRVKTIIEAAVDHTVNNAVLLRIGDAFVDARQDLLVAVDPDNPTNEEKAGVFLSALKEWGKNTVRGTAQKKKAAELNPAFEVDVDAAGTTAEADLD